MKMSIFDEQRKISKNLQIARENEMKRRQQEEKRPIVSSSIDSKVGVIRRMNHTVNRWKKKGVNSYEEFVAYRENPRQRESSVSIREWFDEDDKYRMIWAEYEADKKRAANGERKCTYCGEVKSFDEFTITMGRIKGYKCLKCKE